MKRILLIILLAAAVVGLSHYAFFRTETKPEFDEARLDEVREMVKLCSMKICDEVAIKDSINGKWIFAKAKVNSYIRFDIEQLDYEVRNDTIFMKLPPEEVEIYESTEPGAYQVFDTWDNSLLSRRKMTATEENILKRRMADRYRSAIYQKGYVKRARGSAITTLQTLFGHLKQPIVIIDDAQ